MIKINYFYFLVKNISYSDINSKELYLLPVFIKNNKIIYL